MNNINISNIFSNNKIIIKDSNINNLSVNNLVESNCFNNTLNDEFLINKIKINIKNEIIKINELYETKYKECLLKINTTLDLNLTDIVFSVGSSYFGYGQYNSVECLNYIQKKLRKKNFLALIINKNEIFISWKNFSFLT